LPLDNDSAKLRTELMASQSGRMLLVAQLRQFEAERGYLRGELGRVQHALETVSQELSECSRARSELLSAKNELAALEAEANFLRHSLVTERAIRNSIETSRTWRWTRPLRDLLNANKRQA
jgi:hypothetical protein